MKLLLFTLLTIIPLTWGAIARGDYSDPDHPGKCVYDGNVMDPGTHANIDPTNCYRIECEQNGYAEIATCGSMSPPPNCRYTDYVDISQPYPTCCEQKIECGAEAA